MESIFSELASKWPSVFVSRNDVKQFSGGLISEKYLANLDCAGKGPAGRIRCGRKVAYPVTELIAWLEARSEVIPERKQQSEAAQ